MKNIKVKVLFISWYSYLCVIILFNFVSKKYLQDFFKLFINFKNKCMKIGLIKKQTNISDIEKGLAFI